MLATHRIRQEEITDQLLDVFLTGKLSTVRLEARVAKYGCRPSNDSVLTQYLKALRKDCARPEPRRDRRG